MDLIYFLLFSQELKSNSEKFKSLGCYIEPFWRNNSENVMEASNCCSGAAQLRRLQEGKSIVILTWELSLTRWTDSPFFTLALSHLSPNQSTYHFRFYYLVVFRGLAGRGNPQYSELDLVIKILTHKQNKGFHYSFKPQCHSVSKKDCKNFFHQGKEKKEKSLHDIAELSLNTAGALTGIQGKVRYQVRTIYCFYYNFDHKDWFMSSSFFSLSLSLVPRIHQIEI